MQKIRRAVALLSVAFIVLLIIGTVVCAVTGSRYFWGMFYLMIVVPVVLWVFMWFTRLVNRDSDVVPAEPVRKGTTEEEVEMPVSAKETQRGTEPDESGSEK